ncbi:MAG: hypothetical protein HOO93_05535 [Methyloglobulus sp.]|nr:hypothetical protein [Methyloglobulus sp.]
MKSLQFKPALLAAAVFSISGFTGLASAHCVEGETIASGGANADLYRVNCATGDGSAEAPSTNATDHLKVIARKETAASNTIVAQIAREGYTPSLTSEDSTYAAATSCALETNGGTARTLVAGNGDYNILVTRKGTSVSTYDLIFHCEDSGNVHTITQEVIPGTAGELTSGSLTSTDADFLIDN